VDLAIIISSSSRLWPQLSAAPSTAGMTSDIEQVFQTLLTTGTAIGWAVCAVFVALAGVSEIDPTLENVADPVARQLVAQVGRARHVQLSVDDLVALRVIFRKMLEIVDRKTKLGRHPMFLRRVAEPVDRGSIRQSSRPIGSSRPVRASQRATRRAPAQSRR